MFLSIIYSFDQTECENQLCKCTLVLNVLLHTAHYTLYTLHTLTQLHTTHCTLHCQLKVWSLPGQGGLSGSQGRDCTALYCAKLHHTGFSVLHRNIGSILLNFRRSTLFYSCEQSKAFDTLLVLHLVLVLFLLLNVVLVLLIFLPTFKFNLLFDDIMTMGITENNFVWETS